MITQPPLPERLQILFDAACEEMLTDSQRQELSEALQKDEILRQRFYEYCCLHVQLYFTLRGKRAEIIFPANAKRQPTSPILGFLHDVNQSAMALFSQHVWLSLILVFILVGAAGFGIERWLRTARPEPEQIAQNSVPELVARITDAKDCQWRTNSPSAEKMEQIPVGRRLDLEKGLVQITYSNGAVVLLEGPASFTVDSSKSGSLARGRLFARAETQQSHGFAVSTANARFVDLGTEFGVMADAQNNAEIHVFRGKVELSGQGLNEAVRLAQGTAARVNAESRVEILPQADPNEFVLQIDKPRNKQLDLLDVVAGGNGFNAAWHEGGINPVTGNRDELGSSRELTGDGAYHRTGWQPLVDGAFIPTGKNTKLDSAGHTYDFPTTDKMTSNCIFATSKDSGSKSLFNFAGTGTPYMPSGRGLLIMHANAGISFDLNEIRKAHPGWTPSKFTAIAGNLFSLPDVNRPENYNEKGDVSVFVDGQLRFQRMQIGRTDGPVPLEIEIGPADRFLTLVTTDGTGNHRYTQMVIGDPVLNLEAGP